MLPGCCTDDRDIWGIGDQNSRLSLLVKRLSRGKDTRLVRMGLSHSCSSCADDLGRLWHPGGIQVIGVGLFHLDISAIGIDKQTFAVGACFHETVGGAAEAVERTTFLGLLVVLQAGRAFLFKERHQLGDERRLF